MYRIKPWIVLGYIMISKDSMQLHWSKETVWKWGVYVTYDASSLTWSSRSIKYYVKGGKLYVSRI